MSDCEELVGVTYRGWWGCPYNTRISIMIQVVDLKGVVLILQIR